MTTLRDLRGGDIFRINKVTLKEEIGKRLVDMGLTNGVVGIVLRCALFGDPMEIRIRDYNVSLRRSEAAGVEVELLESFHWHRHGGRGMGRGDRWNGWGGRGFDRMRGGRHAGRHGGPFGAPSGGADSYNPFDLSKGAGPDDSYSPFDLSGLAEKGNTVNAGSPDETDHESSEEHGDNT